jgi:nicotinate dehydrogenase subunit B
MTPQQISRRGALKGALSLLVVARGDLLFAATLSDTPSRNLPGHIRSLSPDRLDSWLTLHDNGQVTAYFGMMDAGMGVDTAMAQIVAEELGIDPAHVTVIMADTGLTVQQGGTGGSSACQRGAKPLRAAAAQARGLLIARAATLLAVAPGDLSMRDGRVETVARPARSIGIGDLVTRETLDGTLAWNGKFGGALAVTAQTEPKAQDQYTVVGRPLPRHDIPAKVFAELEYCHNVAVPGMLHGRMIRPPVANARPIAVDNASVADIPGVRIVHVADLLGVVAPVEWDAIKAARQLKVEWSASSAPFPAMDQLYDHLRQAPVVASNGGSGFSGKVAYDPAPVEAAIAASHRTLRAEYEMPFQSHARLGPSIAVADVRDGRAVIYSDAQKTHYQRDGIARLLGLSPDDVRVIWRHGAGSYGRSDADESAFEAAILSREVRAPVRVQWMRDEGHGWDPKAPPAVFTLKAGLDEHDALTGWYFRAKGLSGWDVLYQASDPRDTLAGMLLGLEKGDAHNYGTPDDSYAFGPSVSFWETCAPLQRQASPLRCAHMRAPQELQVAFAHESFVDEIALAVRQDPVQFRLSHLKHPAKIAVLKAAAKAAGWQERVLPIAPVKAGKLLQGRGVAVAGFGNSVVATICEVEVDRASGRIWPRRVTVAHDCGLIINPLSLKGVIEGGTLQGLSRVLCEEVQFDEQAVRSVDWNTYPILDVQDVPESIEIVLLQTPGAPASGAGEASHVPIAAALANAVYDATGVRFRRIPLTPDRVKAGLIA